MRKRHCWSELPSQRHCWSELPSHLLDLIMDMLNTPQFISDYFRFGCVCVSWNSAFNNHKPYPFHSTPLLLVPPSFPSLNKKKKHKTKLRRFYSISDKMVNDKLDVRMPRYRHCRGSSHGWLITVDDDAAASFAIRLFNPFLTSLPTSNVNNIGMEILLPPLKTFPIKHGFQGYNYLLKAVLSDNPLSDLTKYTVMAIYGPSSRLAFYKPGDNDWTPIKSPKIEGSRRGFFSDVIYWQGKFFAVHSKGTVVVVYDDDVVVYDDDVGEGKGMTAKVLVQPLSLENTFSEKYLVVESSRRELLQVHRIKHLDMDIPNDKKMTYSTTGFRVFKLVIADTAADSAKEENYEWVEVRHLCGDSIFLGHNSSISIRASDYPGCKPNSIYYTDDSDFYIDRPQDGPHDMGVFNIEDGSFDRYFPNYSKDNQVSIWPVPIWIQPSIPNKKRRT